VNSRQQAPQANGGGAFGPWGEPAVIITYADSGTGKSSDLIASFPGACVLAQKGALKPVVGVFGLPRDSLWTVEIRTLYDAISLAQQIAQLPVDKRPPALGIDDLSLLAGNTLTAMKASGKYGRNPYALWGDLRDLVQTLGNVCRWDAGIHVVINGHEQAPYTADDGTFHKGGPRLPSKALTAMIPYVADTVLRGRKADATAPRKGSPWQAVYDCEFSDRWILKDRHGMYGLGLPMNLSEWLRAVGYVIPRARGLEWQSAWVQLIAESLHAGNDIAKVKAAAIERLQAAGHDPRHIRWALRDGIDRAAFWKAQGSVLDF